MQGSQPRKFHSLLFPFQSNFQRGNEMKGLDRCNVKVVVYRGGSCGYFVCGGSSVYHHQAACSLSITLSATELLLWLHTQCYSCYTPALFTITNFFHPQNTILHLFLQHFRNNVNIPITTSRLRLAVLLLVLLLSAFLFLQQDGTITACAKRICKLQVSSFYF